MAQSEFLKTFLSAPPPPSLRLAVARGVAPVPPHELLELLVNLASDPDAEVAAVSQQSLKSWDEEELATQLAANNCSPPVLAYFATGSPVEPLAEAIVLNPSTPVASIAKLAQQASPKILEMILYNRVRLQECPEILAQIQRNPSASTTVINRVHEIENQLIAGGQTEYKLQGATDPQSSAETGAAIASQEDDWSLEDLSLEGLPVGFDTEALGTIEKLARLTVQQRIHVALRGNREERSFLIRDPVKDVSRTVLRSPKLSESEVEAFASMPTVSDDILRDIARNRDWTRNYVVRQNLVKNPKTPATVAQRLLHRLMSRDLERLTRDRGVSEAVRRNAQRELANRTARRN